VPDVNTATNKLHAVTLHVPEDARPILADHGDSSQIHDELAFPQRIARLFPSSIKLCSPGFDDPACENELSSNFGVDGCDLQHDSSAATMLKGKANAKDEGTGSY
jgi:hypothetical protein